MNFIITSFIVIFKIFPFLSFLFKVSTINTDDVHYLVGLLHYKNGYFQCFSCGHCTTTIPEAKKSGDRKHSTPGLLAAGNPCHLAVPGELKVLTGSWKEEY